MDDVSLVVLKEAAGRLPFLHHKLVRNLQTIKYQVEHFNIIACRTAFTIQIFERLEVPVTDDDQRPLVRIAIILFGTGGQHH